MCHFPMSMHVVLLYRIYLLLIKKNGYGNSFDVCLIRDFLLKPRTLKDLICINYTKSAGKKLRGCASRGEWTRGQLERKGVKEDPLLMLLIFITLLFFSRVEGVWARQSKKGMPWRCVTDRCVLERSPWDLASLVWCVLRTLCPWTMCPDPQELLRSDTRMAAPLWCTIGPV